MAISAVLLAGGQGRRMGGVNKALLPWGDGTLIDRQFQIASEYAEDIIVVSNDDALKSRLAANPSIRVVPDFFPGEGPLAGLQAGLKAALHDRVWLLACDQPFLSLDAARLLSDQLSIGEYQAVVPVIGGRPQPLHALYRKGLADQAESLLQAGERKMFSLLESINWCAVEETEFLNRGISLRFTDDVDTPEQYERAKHLFMEE